MRKNLLLGFALMLLIVFQALGQTDVTISGKLTDKEGVPVPGATITVKGKTGLGTVTDADGNYTITVPKGSTLQFSGAGFKDKTIVVGDQTTVNASMESDEEIAGITVTTAYGQVIDKTLKTGALTSVSGKDFENLPMQSFDRAMQGRMSGVAVNAASGAPGGGLTVRIRGTGSVLASNAPLYIVDGVQITPGAVSGQGSSNTLGSINPNDIESIEVLKDAASAAIYGAQSANGVVIITTKKGKKNSDNFSFTMQEGFVQPVRLYEMLNNRQYASLKREAKLNDVTTTLGRTPTDAELDFALNNPLASASLGNLSGLGSNVLYGDPDNPNLVNFDWKKNVFRTARLRTYDFTYSGGGEKSRFYVSAAYQRQEGQIIKNQWERLTLRANIDVKPSKRFALQSNNSVSVQGIFGSIAGGDGNFLNSPFFGSFVSSPTKNAYNADGSFAQYSDNVLAFNYNILQGINQEIRRGSGVQFVNSLRGTYNILPSLSVTSFVGVDWLNNRDENLRPASIPAFAPGNLFNRYDRDFSMNTSHTINYNKTIGQNHNVSALAGYEYRFRQFMFTSALGRTVTPGITTLTGGVPSGTTAATFSTALGNVFENDRAGWFTQAKYNFKEKYFIDGTFRRDGSSKFGRNTKYGNFYATSIGWRISEEAFMQGVKDQVSELKVRASYGYTGNSEIDDYRNVTTFSGSGLYLGTSAIRPNTLGNDILTWEGSRQMNVAVDYGFLRGNRIFGSLDFWRRDTEDALFNVSVPVDGGVRPSNITRNVGKIRNQGIDFEVGAVLFNNPEKLQWTSTFNITYQENKVLDLPEGNNVIRIGTGAAAVDVFRGYPLSSYILPAYAGVNPATGQGMYYDGNNNIVYQPLGYLVDNNTKAINFRDDRYLGTGLPRIFGGWNNQLSYKGITLEFLWQYQYGNMAINGDYLNNLHNSMEGGDNNVTKALDRWTKPGDITNVPKLSLTGSLNGVSSALASSRYLEDASYLRLKTVTLGYTIPTERLKGFKSARIFVQSVNLLTFTKSNIIDPEIIVAAGNATGGGGTINQFPQGRQFSIGASLGF
ncbi:MAG: SusC/RagA family TonB-linked outer membrane protein [Raineya sp.]|jgi:TonB-linked SusC/RagA family outer membrane protein|nr:SusC/RagA family TonB-linked outer membrane protein [Raineya sp.]